jgi:hypothetical protein
MSVAIVLVGRSWTSCQNTELDDHITNDACLNGPTYITFSDDEESNWKEFLIRYDRFGFVQLLNDL